MLTGIILGILLGVVTGFIPGLNLSLFFLFAYQQELSPNFLLSFFLFAGVINSIVSHVTMLTPIAIADDPLYLTPLQQEIQKGKGIESIHHAILSFLCGIFLILIMGIFLMLVDEIEILSLGLEYVPLSLIIAIYLWLSLIKKSQNKLIAIIYILILTLSAGIFLNKFPNQTMLIFSTALFGCGLSFNLKSTKIPPQSFGYPQVNEFNITYLLLGLISGWLIGLPTSALIASVVKKEDSNTFIIANTSLAKGAATGMSILLILTNSGARDTSSTYISYLNLDFNISIALGLIGLIFAILLYFKNNIYLFCKIYLNLIKLLPLNFIKFLIISFNSFTLFSLINYLAIPVIILGIFLSKFISQGAVDRSLSLSALSFIPLYSLF